jgi:Mrp family chromosome partitioning ATPase
MRTVIDALARDHLVLLDAPPLLPVTDAGLLTAMCDGALLVQAAGKTQIEHSQHCRRVLDQVGGRLLGVVLNKAPQRGAGAALSYGYGYGSHEYAAVPEEAADKGRRRSLR